MREMGNPDRMAARLRYAIEQNGITAAELARRAGMHKSSITQYLQGKHTASMDGAERLAAILQVSPAWLMGYDVPITDDEESDLRIGIRALNKKRFIQVGNTAVNMDHVVTITNEDNGCITVLLDTGSTIQGVMIE